MEHQEMTWMPATAAVSFFVAIRIYWVRGHRQYITWGSGRVWVRLCWKRTATLFLIFFSLHFLLCRYRPPFNCEQMVEMFQSRVRQWRQWRHTDSLFYDIINSYCPCVCIYVAWALNVRCWCVTGVCVRVGVCVFFLLFFCDFPRSFASHFSLFYWRLVRWMRAHNTT